MMTRSQGLLWLGLQLAVTASGSAGVLLGPAAAFFTFVLTLVLSIAALKKAWAQRHEADPNRALGDGLAGAGLVIFLGLIFTVNLLSALAALLLMAALALCVQLNNYRKYYLLQVVSFVLLMVGAAEAVSGSYLLVMVAYCLFAAFALSEAWLDQGVHSDSSAAAQPADESVIQGPGFAQRARISGVIMGLAVLVYLLLPRLDALNLGAQESGGDFYTNPNWSQKADSSVNEPYKKPPKPENSSQSMYDQLQQITDLSRFSGDGYRYDGFSEKFDIRSGERSGGVDLNAIVARMKADHGTYLKVRTFDTFDGTRWASSSEDISRKISVGSFGEVVINPRAAGQFQQVITLERAMPAWLPVAPDPVSLNVPADVVALDQFGQPLMPSTLSPGTRYTVLSTQEVFDNRLLSHTPAADKNDLQLPKGFDPRIARLARTVTERESTVYGKAVALEQHLRTQYAYSFESILRSQGRTPLSEFLFDDKKGHCEYFASAMTMMLRTLKIPARLVTGFSVSTRNPLTGFFEIRAIDGHAWTEAWIDGRWVTFEPTAYYQMPAMEQSAFAAEQINDYARDLLKRNETTGEDSVSLLGLLSSLWLALSTVVIVVLSYTKLLLLTLWPVLLVAAVLAAVAWFSRHLWLAQVLAWWSFWQMKRYQPTQAALALSFYLFHLQRISERKVPAREPAQLLGDWLAQVAEAFGEQPEYEQWQQLVEQVVYQGQDADVQRMQTLALTLASRLVR
ncbi:transglutaminaseTgpA domain-containing protein [Thalassolituus sp. LLYu03]|uniref:transglutaminase family protein n=1 Tax=Thalassolituus sp. LLYu03 TaxID=3421656 RepID=UPI003D2E0532